MQKFLDPTNDVAFKKIFGTESQKPALISFLNAVLRLKEGSRIIETEFIETIQFLPQENIPEIREGRRVIFDIRCRDESGNDFIVEMQNRSIPEFVKRSQFYAAKVYGNQLSAGRKYFELCPVVMVAISSQCLFDDSRKPVSYHRIMNEETLNVHLKDLTFVFVELPKFNK